MHTHSEAYSQPGYTCLQPSHPTGAPHGAEIGRVRRLSQMKGVSDWLGGRPAWFARKARLETTYYIKAPLSSEWHAPQGKIREVVCTRHHITGCYVWMSECRGCALETEVFGTLQRTRGEKQSVYRFTYAQVGGVCVQVRGTFSSSSSHAINLRSKGIACHHYTKP